MTVIVWVLNVAAILGIAVWIARKESARVRVLFWPALGIKLLAGIGLGLVYQRYYPTGDTFNFFEQAQLQVRLAETHFAEYVRYLWQDLDVEWKGAARSVFFVKGVSIVSVIDRGDYWITSLWFSLLSFMASLYLFRSVIRLLDQSFAAAAFAFLFFPSVLFWGSGIIKESMGLAALMVVCGVYLNWMMGNRPSPWELIFAVLGIWIAWNLKYYWVSVFLPVVFTSLAVQLLSYRLAITPRMKFYGWIILFFILCLGVSLLHPNFYPERILQVVIENNQAFALNSDPPDVIHYNQLEPTWSSIILNAPWALVSGLYRPFPWEADTALKLAASLENAVLFLLSVSALWRIPEFLRAQHRLITLSVIVYVVVLCIFLALSTPNFGSLARYKIGFLPFLVFLVTYKNPLFNLRTFAINFKEWKIR